MSHLTIQQLNNTHFESRFKRTESFRSFGPFFANQIKLLSKTKTRVVAATTVLHWTQYLPIDCSSIPFLNSPKRTTSLIKNTFTLPKLVQKNITLTKTASSFAKSFSSTSLSKKMGNAFLEITLAVLSVGDAAISGLQALTKTGLLSPSRISKTAWETCNRGTTIASITSYFLQLIIDGMDLHKLNKKHSDFWDLKKVKLIPTVTKTAIKLSVSLFTIAALWINFAIAPLFWSLLSITLFSLRLCKGMLSELSKSETKEKLLKIPHTKI